jgi:hypothetical protein
MGRNTTFKPDFGELEPQEVEPKEPGLPILDAAAEDFDGQPAQTQPVVSNPRRRKRLSWFDWD